MAIYSTSERQDVMDYIESFMKQNEHIAALVAVGSGAYGYNDEFSDLDMVVAVDSEENVASVKDYVAAKLNEKLKFIYFKQPPYIPLQVYLSKNYLEIDIGYGVYTSAAAFKEHWRVLFDRTGTVDGAMQRSWDSIKNAVKTDEHTAKLANCSDMVWHSLLSAAVAIKRGQCWRANGELDFSRNLLIELFGFRYALETARGKEVDKLPESELAVLKKTLVPELSPDTLWQSLEALTDAVYTELERFGEQACIKVNREQVSEYINACRNS